ncbi:MFS transporter [Aquabacterium sp. OR-4]|uniref:MFS transporter n=1 Tax=Aquabacterium sp. OR-4 TaxID=2978127 RepID=UPI0021B4C8AB|nr:MFS transporter [Aquabacterium sp. OR-4]MDT7835942.1 MFS transporter [Aquabacterium sp. OR-4]
MLRDPVYRRLFGSVLIASLGQQVTLLALPLTAALLLQASPTQMGWLIAMETLPFALLSLPAGVWLDRVRKLPVVVAGELLVALSVASVAASWWLGWLGMPWMYAVAFLIGAVNASAGSASQIVLMQVVPRDKLVQAHARNALASSGAEVMGPGLAGLLIKLVGAPLALLLDALALLSSAAILRGLPVHETVAPRRDVSFGRDLREGLRFVSGQRLLVALAAAVGVWQLCHHAAQAVQILYASRTLGLSEQAVGLCYVGLGVGTVAASTLGDRLSQRHGPGPTLVLGFAMCSAGWLLPALTPPGSAALGVAGFAGMMVLTGAGAVLVFINFLALRQAVTPEPLLGRMTTTMRWLILLPGVPGALLGGWIGEHVSLRATLACVGLTAALLALLAWRTGVIRNVRELPSTAEA